MKFRVVVDPEPRPTIIPQDERESSDDKGFGSCLEVVIDMARQTFSSSALRVSGGQDAENERHLYIDLDIKAGDLATEEPAIGQRVWSSGTGYLRPVHCAVYFVLGRR